MDDLQIQMVFDEIGRALLRRGKNPDDIEEYLECESQRVAQELRDEIDDQPSIEGIRHDYHPIR